MFFDTNTAIAGASDLDLIVMCAWIVHPGAEMGQPSGIAWNGPYQGYWHYYKLYRLFPDLNVNPNPVRIYCDLTGVIEAAGAVVGVDRTTNQADHDYAVAICQKRLLQDQS